jgi:hypothetical protein
VLEKNIIRQMKMGIVEFIIAGLRTNRRNSDKQNETNGAANINHCAHEDRKTPIGPRRRRRLVHLSAARLISDPHGRIACRAIIVGDSTNPIRLRGDDVRDQQKSA